MRVLLVDDSGRTAGSVRAVHNHLVIEDGIEREKVYVDPRGFAVPALPAPLLGLRCVTPEVPRIRSVADAALALLVSAYWPEIVHPETGRAYQMTLSYALPLWLDARWRRWTAANLRIALEGGQIIPVPSSDLLAVDPSTQPLETLVHRQRRLLKRHESTTVDDVGDIDEIVEVWQDFCRTRFGTSLTDIQVEALKSVFVMSGCEVRRFMNEGNVIARSLVCLHAPSRTLFDMLAPWDLERGELRPGIYSGHANLLEARARGFRYCLCYGDFPYKRAILGGLETLRLQDLQAREASRALAPVEADLSSKDAGDSVAGGSLVPLIEGDGLLAQAGAVEEALATPAGDPLT